MSNNIVFDEVLKVESIDKEKKIFEKVQRCEGKTQKTNYNIILDINSELYPMEVDGLYSFDYELTSNKKNTLMDKFEYVMRGRVFQFSSEKKRNVESTEKDSLCISISFGGLLLDISKLSRDTTTGKPKSFEDINLDEELYLLIKKIKK